MKFKNNYQINKFYNSLKDGDIIEITRDLSLGKRQKDMIQTLSIRVADLTRPDIIVLLSKFPIIELKKIKDGY